MPKGLPVRGVTRFARYALPQPVHSLSLAFTGFGCLVKAIGSDNYVFHSGRLNGLIPPPSQNTYRTTLCSIGETRDCSSQFPRKRGDRLCHSHSMSIAQRGSRDLPTLCWNGWSPLPTSLSRLSCASLRTTVISTEAEKHSHAAEIQTACKPMVVAMTLPSSFGD